MLKQLKNGIIHGIGILLVIGIAGIAYSAWPTSVDRAVENTPLTAAKYNQIVDRLESIQPEQLATAWVNFDGTNCPLTSGEYLCDIGEGGKYNVDKVVKLTTGQYEIYFLKEMNNTSYVVNTLTTGNSSWYSYRQLSGVMTLFKNKVTITTGQVHEISTFAEDYPEVHVQIFGGKTY